MASPSSSVLNEVRRLRYAAFVRSLHGGADGGADSLASEEDSSWHPTLGDEDSDVPPVVLQTLVDHGLVDLSGPPSPVHENDDASDSAGSTGSTTTPTTVGTDSVSRGTDDPVTPNFEGTEDAYTEEKKNEEGEEEGDEAPTVATPFEPVFIPGSTGAAPSDTSSHTDDDDNAMGGEGDVPNHRHNTRYAARLRTQGL